VNSVRARVRFIELEQQAAIRHNSIISFFRAFLPSSPRYDSSRIHPRGSRRPHPRSSLYSSFSVSFVLLENRESQIPNTSLSALYASGIFFGRGPCVCVSMYICKIVIKDTIRSTSVVETDVTILLPRVCPSLYACIHICICMISVMLDRDRLTVFQIR